MIYQSTGRHKLKSRMKLTSRYHLMVQQLRFALPIFGRLGDFGDSTGLGCTRSFRCACFHLKYDAPIAWQCLDLGWRLLWKSRGWLHRGFLLLAGCLSIHRLLGRLVCPSSTSRSSSLQCGLGHPLARSPTGLLRRVVAQPIG